MSGALQRDSDREFAFGDADFRFISEWTYARTGIVLAEHKRDMVYSRLSRRLRALSLSSFAEYCNLIQGEGGAEEEGNLVNAITTNLTSFFREKHHFDHLREELEKLCAEAGRNVRIRIWSAGCSSGMETYSIAMVLQSVLEKYGAVDARILATDIDTTVLAKAAEGIYSASEMEHIPDTYRKYVSQDRKSDSMLVADSLKQLIAFKRLNLLEPWPMKGPFDVLFCRNVVIYFDKPTQKKLFARYADILKPSGWIYIGHSENLQQVCDRFTLMGRTIYRKVSR